MPDGVRRRGVIGSVNLEALPDLIAEARDAGFPIVLERATPLPAHAQRLMDSLGVEVRVVSSTSDITARQRMRGRTMGNFQQVGDSDGHQPRGRARADWIDFRASVARVYRRRDVGEQPEVCEACGTETDVADVVHSPKCPVFLGTLPKTKAADWDQNAAITAIRLWAHEHDGEPPSSEDWRRPVNGYPSYGIVVQLFGSWNDGIAAAGLEPRTHRLREPKADELASDPAPDGATSVASPSPGPPLGSGEPGSRTHTQTQKENTIVDCKIDGCENDASDAPKAGPTARLCAEHRAAKSSEISAARTGRPRGAPPEQQPVPPPVAEPPAANGHVVTTTDKVRELLALSERVDELRTQLSVAEAEMRKAAETISAA